MTMLKSLALLLAVAGSSCSFSPASAQSEVRYYLAEGYGEDRVLQENVCSVAWSPDGTRLLVAAEEVSFLFDAESGEALWTSEEGAFAYAASFSPDGELFALGLNEGAVGIWNAKTCLEVAELPPAKDAPTVSALTFSPGGGELLIGDREGRIRRWAFATDGPPSTMARIGGPDSPRRVTCIRLFPDQERCLAAGEGELLLFDLETGEERLRVPGDFDSADISPDGAAIACSRDGLAEVLSASEGSTLAFHGGYRAAVRAVAFLADGSRCISGDWSGEVAVWEAASGELVQELTRLDRVTCIAPRPGSSDIAVGLARYRLGLPPEGWEDWASAAAEVPEDQDGESLAPVVHLSGRRYVNAGSILGCHLNLKTRDRFLSVPAGELDAVGKRCRAEILDRASALGADVTGLAHFFAGGFRQWSEDSLWEPPEPGDAHDPATEEESATPENPVVPCYVDRVLIFDRPVWIVVGRALYGYPVLLVDVRTGERITYAAVGR